MKEVVDIFYRLWGQLIAHDIIYGAPVMMPITKEEALIILGAITVCNSEGISGIDGDDMDVERQQIVNNQLLKKIFLLFPEFKDEYDYLILG